MGIGSILVYAIHSLSLRLQEFVAVLPSNRHYGSSTTRSGVSRCHWISHDKHKHTKRHHPGGGCSWNDVSNFSTPQTRLCHVSSQATKQWQNHQRHNPTATRSSLQRPGTFKSLEDGATKITGMGVGIWCHGSGSSNHTTTTTVTTRTFNTLDPEFPIVENGKGYAGSFGKSTHFYRHGEWISLQTSFLGGNRPGIHMGEWYSPPETLATVTTTTTTTKATTINGAFGYWGRNDWSFVAYLGP